ncbi:MAG: hypothetical protein M3P22_02580 [bacterium]|nr:hypothetical protein [bacterium]
MNNYFKKIKYNGGAAMILSIVFFLSISLAIIAGLVSPTVREFKITGDRNKAKQSFFLSESGIEDAFYRLKNNFTLTSPTSITIDGNTVTTTITDSGGQKIISAVGDVANRERTNELILDAGTGVSFSYGMQSGQGGFTMSNGSQVNGSVYSNGSIIGSGTITGSATSANSSALAADQTNDSGIPAYDVQFGNANGTQDFAQSFQVSSTDLVNKVELYLKKVSTPGNLTVHIVTDNSGVPSTTELANGSLSASLVSTSYGWVSVPFSSNPQLTAGTTYWIVIDGGTSSSKYYYIGANANGYANGTGKIGTYSGTWNNTSPSGLDGFFKLYLGGFTGLISGITVGSGGVGNTYAHTVNNSTIAGTNYCQTGSGNNKSCNTSLADPTQVALPISDQNIIDWKAEATAGGVYSGNYVVSGSQSYGPKEITGNLSFENGAILTVTGTLWVHGTIDVSNNATVRLSSSYGASEGVIVADGNVIIGNNANFYGSGTTGSYPMVLTTSNSSSAINLSNNAGAVILYAGNGTINVDNNAGATALTAYRITLGNNAIINYDSGLVNSNFVSGPSGGWNVTSWKETQ